MRRLRQAGQDHSCSPTLCSSSTTRRLFFFLRTIRFGRLCCPSSVGSHCSSSSNIAYTRTTNWSLNPCGSCPECSFIEYRAFLVNGIALTYGFSSRLFDNQVNVWFWVLPPAFLLGLACHQRIQLRKRRCKTHPTEQRPHLSGDAATSLSPGRRSYRSRLTG